MGGTATRRAAVAALVLVGLAFLVVGGVVAVNTSHVKRQYLMKQALDGMEIGPVEKGPWKYNHPTQTDDEWVHAGYWLCRGEGGAPGYAHSQWQSPIDIPTTNRGTVKTEDNPTFVAKDGGCRTGEQEWNEHTYETAFKGCENLEATFKGTVYTLRQLHFHSLSENTVNKEHYAAEVHMVHTSEDGKVLVVGVFIERAQGSEHSFLTKMFNDGYEPIHKFGGKLKLPINPYELLNMDGGYSSFLGSFTTPPCTPDVEWIMMEDPVSISSDHLGTFQSFLNNTAKQPDSNGHNFRPVQHLNNRPVNFGQLSKNNFPK